MHFCDIAINLSSLYDNCKLFHGEQYDLCILITIFYFNEINLLTETIVLIMTQDILFIFCV